MEFEIKKLDKRHAWHNQFPYMIEFRRRPSFSQTPTSGVLDFDQARRWFNESWGWTQDVETRYEIIKVKRLAKETAKEEVNENWSYSIRYNEYRIYTSEQALTMFKLRWE